MISPELTGEYEAFLKRYDEPDLRHYASTAEDLRRHIDGIESSHKGARVHLAEAFDGLKDAISRAKSGLPYAPID